MKYLIASTVYVAAIVVANLLVAALGPAASPVIGFLLIGLDLTFRDVLHDAWVGKGVAWRMPALIAVASAVTFVVNPAASKIAAASAIAFGAAALADWSVYALMANRGRMARINGSNAVGALVDSILFPTLAFGMFMPEIVVLQWIAKFFGGMLWAMALRRIKIA